MPAIELRHVSKTFGACTACADVNLAIAEGEFVTLLGASGCGKTTTLNMIAGLEDATSGDILMNGRRVNDLSPVERDVAMVFQNYALYPHMTVAQQHRLHAEDARACAATRSASASRTWPASLELSVACSSVCHRSSRAASSSGSPLAAPWCASRKVFLFDEPFSNLDAGLRVRMRAEVKELHQRLGVTSIFVTHDQEEAMSISDRIAVMNMAAASSSSARRRRSMPAPATRYVATFIGSPRIELVPAEIIDADGKASRPVTLPSACRSIGRPASWPARSRSASGRSMCSSASSGIPGDRRLVQPVGPATHVTLDWEGGALVASLPGFVRLVPAPGRSG